MMKIIIFAAFLSLSSFGTTWALSKVPGVGDNAALAFAIGFVGFVISIYLTTAVFGMHV